MPKQKQEEKKMEEVYERVYDDPLNNDGTPKENKLLGKFEILEGDMSDYSYEVYGRGEDGILYKIIGIEISFYNGGTKNFIKKLEDTEDVRVFKKYSINPPKILRKIYKIKE